MLPLPYFSVQHAMQAWNLHAVCHFAVGISGLLPCRRNLLVSMGVSLLSLQYHIRSFVKKMACHKPGLQLQSADEQGRRKAQERFQQLKTAYEVLRNPELRREYDNGRMAEAA